MYVRLRFVDGTAVALGMDEDEARTLRANYERASVTGGALTLQLDDDTVMYPANRIASVLMRPASVQRAIRGAVAQGRNLMDGRQTGDRERFTEQVQAALQTLTAYEEAGQLDEEDAQLPQQMRVFLDALRRGA